MEISGSRRYIRLGLLLILSSPKSIGIFQRFVVLCSHAIFRASTGPAPFFQKLIRPSPGVANRFSRYPCLSRAQRSVSCLPFIVQRPFEGVPASGGHGPRGKHCRLAPLLHPFPSVFFFPVFCYPTTRFPFRMPMCL